MTPRQVWDGLSPSDQIEAISDRAPRSGYVFRAVISRKTKSGFIEVQKDEGWDTVTLVSKKMRLRPTAQKETD